RRPLRRRRRHAPARPWPADAAAGDARDRRRHLPAGGNEVQHDRMVGNQARHPGTPGRRYRHVQHHCRRAARQAALQRAMTSRLPVAASLAAIALLAAVPQLSTLADGTGAGPTTARDGWTAEELGVLASLQLAGLPPA